MRSKKLRRKKVKHKKLEKIKKLNSVKREKSISLEKYNKTTCEGDLQENIHNRLSSKQCYRSYTLGKKVSDVKFFAQIRESYFKYLQNVVSDNCAFCDSIITDEILEKLALELEQNALLACLQIDIYKKSMMKIIKDIKKCTEEKQVHKEVKKLLPGSQEEKTVDTTNLPVVETYNRIPTIASTRTDDNVDDTTNLWDEQLNYVSNSYYPVTDQRFTENQPDTDSQFWVESETFSTGVDHSNYWTNESNINVFESSKHVIDDQSSILENNFCDLNGKDNTQQNAQNHCNETADPLLLSRNQLQKLVEQTLIETEKINKLKRDEQEKAYIAQILEGDDSLDDNFNDSLSDNENESKENIDESNLLDRLEKMRELFGMEEEESQNDVVPEKQKPKTKVQHASTHVRRPTIWRYEKFIQLHKYSIIAAEMTFERRQINRNIFLDLFGEDSDEEHENEYSSTEKFRASCTERISSWVVKYLMPFYHEKRILGRNVFKSLGHYVSDAIVDKIQYPDEWTVKYLVSKFFPPKKKYACEEDILNFQLI